MTPLFQSDIMELAKEGGGVMSHKKHRMYNTSGKQNSGSHVFSLNEEFTNQIPTYFLDSGVVITYANIEEWEMYGARLKLTALPAM